MIQVKAYVRQSVDGAWRIGERDISLDSVVIAYQQGYSPETIQQLYPALTLEEVYGAIAFYLANRDEVHENHQRQEARWQQLRQSAAANPSPVVARLRALAQAGNQAAP